MPKLLTAVGRHWYKKPLLFSALVRQQTILYNSESRRIPARIVNLNQAHIGPILRANARLNVEFRKMISI